MTRPTKRETIIIIILVIAGLLSAFVGGPYFEKPSSYKGTIDALDERENTIYKLTISSAVISTAIAAIPSDATSGVSDSITDLNIFFVICLTAILLEKYLLTSVGFLFFRIIIPIVCLLCIIYCLNHSLACKKWAFKFLLFGLIVFLLVPVSTTIGTKIIETNSAMIEDVINTEQQDLNLIQKITTNVTNALASAQNKLKECVNSASVMLLSTCIMPLLVIVVMIWLTNLFFGTNLNNPSMHDIPRIRNRIKRKPERLMEIQDE